MKWVFFICALLVITPASAAAPMNGGANAGTKAGPSTAMTPTPDERAKQWLTLVDDGNYADAYTQLGAYARTKISTQAWSDNISAMRAPLGAMSSRTLKDIKLTKTLPGMRAGQYATVRYDSVFAHKTGAVETLVLTSENGGWSAVSYSIS